MSENIPNNVAAAIQTAKEENGTEHKMALLWIQDHPDGTVQVGADFGDAVDQESQAHQMVMTLLNSVLSTAKNYQAIEDTAPDTNVEPSRIITPN